MRLSKFAPFSWVVLGWNLIVILWGALVRATGSGAGCGRHWPLCNGELIPQAPQVAVMIEFTHRVLSAGAIILIGIMVVWGFRTSPKGHPARKGLVAAGLLILIESLLGAGLVLFELVAENSSEIRAVAVALHLANTFLLVASLALTAYWATGGAPVDLASNKRPAVFLGTGLLGMLLIGMSGAVTALGDTLFPAGSLVEGIVQDLDAGAHFLIQMRVYHPLIALAIALYSLQVVRTLHAKNHGLARKMLVALSSIGVLQILIGTINLLLLAPIPMQLIHLFTAESVWIVYVLTSAAILAN